MNSNVVMNPAPPAPIVTYAGFWKRVAAHLIDKLIISVAALIIVIPFFIVLGVGVYAGQEFDQYSSLGMIFALMATYALAIVLILLVDWLYFALMESRTGATLGKMALGIVVTDLLGNRISFGRATGRHFSKIISGLILYVGYMMAGFTQQKQALHDIIASTLVVNKR